MRQRHFRFVHRPRNSYDWQSEGLWAWREAGKNGVLAGRRGWYGWGRRGWGAGDRRVLAVGCFLSGTGPF
ncbi:hypothetical protein STTU_3029 [Streptomyces sp. Tu6071]|nr:hypothetical protein STTU_3029 [Streptomyces sp. Tu6071]